MMGNGNVCDGGRIAREKHGIFVSMRLVARQSTLTAQSTADKAKYERDRGIDERQIFFITKAEGQWVHQLCLRVASALGFGLDS